MFSAVLRVIPKSLCRSNLKPNDLGDWLQTYDRLIARGYSRGGGNAQLIVFIIAL
jgi:hypothetical protein